MTTQGPRVSALGLLALLFAIVALSASLISAGLWVNAQKPESPDPIPQGFFLGVTAGGNVSETKALIDKVKGYTNLITFTNMNVTKNLTSLVEVCDYAYDAGLSFLVHQIFPYPGSNYTYDPITWQADSRVLYGDKFLGYYLWDEPGGNQLDRGSFRQFDKTSWTPPTYRDAANEYVYYLYLQMRDFVKTGVPLFTSDYGLYWYDYEAGYSTILCEFAWNHSRPVSIAQCRGAAEMHNSSWGAMMTWTYDTAPYIEPAPELYQDMVTAYNAGAKYVVVFNSPQTGLYGMLSEDHFKVIKQLRDYVSANPQNSTSNTQKIAYVLPDNYGWGLRVLNDTIWGVWNADAQSPIIWNNVTSFVQTYGDGFDIIYGSPWTMLFGKYHYDQMFTWNGTFRTFR